MVTEYIDQFKGILPTQIQDYWYLVVLIAFLILLLIIVNVGKFLFRSHKQKVQSFKEEHHPINVARNAAALQPKPVALPRTKRPVVPAQPAMVAHNVHEPHGDTGQLDHFISSQLNANFELLLIRNNLLLAGWDARTIDEAIGRVQQEREKEKEKSKKEEKKQSKGSSPGKDAIDEQSEESQEEESS